MVCSPPSASSLPASCIFFCSIDLSNWLRALNQKARGREASKFTYHHRGMLAYIGGYKALIDSPATKRSGFLTWIIWNAAYLTKLVSVKNKLMIPLYWFKAFVFGRDVSRF
jgi:NADH dehydrogenase FAD-containing subunit